MGNITSSIYKSPTISYNLKNLVINRKNRLKISACSIQGYRESMEDYYNIITYRNFIGIGLYDGHSGNAISKKLAREFVISLYKKIKYKTKRKKNYDIKYINQIIYNFFIEYDNELRKLNFKNEGSTAVILLIINNNIYIANCGDSRCILYNGKELFIKTKDHKPNDPTEYARIIKTNHKVKEDRIDSLINISRTFGDFTFKDNGKHINAIIPNPSIYNSNIDYCKFAVMISDGISNVITDKEICKYIDNRLYIGDKLSSICKNIINYCLYKNSCDNMSIVIILCHEYTIDKERKSNDELYNKIIKDEIKKIMNNKTEINKKYNYNNVIKIVNILNTSIKYNISFKIPLVNKYYKQYIKQYINLHNMK